MSVTQTFTLRYMAYAHTNANYKPNVMGYYNDKVPFTAKDFYIQTISVSENARFTVEMPNIFTGYEVGYTDEDPRAYDKWDHDPLRTWQTQLNFAVYCATTALGVGPEHFNGSLRSFYRFPMYYQTRRILNLCSMPTPLESHHDPINNPCDYAAYKKIIAEYGVEPGSVNKAMQSSFDASYVTDPLLKPRYYFRNRYYGTIDFPSKYVWYTKSDDWVRWINPNPRGFNKLSLEKISESVRVYVYLILTSQANARSRIVGNDASALNAQQIFKNNFEDTVKRRVNLAEDIKRYQNVLDKASSKVDFLVGEGIYMLPSDMNLRIRESVTGYNNKILISKKGFSISKNQKVNNNNLIVMAPKPKPVVLVNKLTASVINKPTVPITPIADTVAVTPATPTDAITTEEEVVLGVTLAIIAGVIMIYRRWMI